MSLTADQPMITATVELRRTVTVTVPLPDGVTATDIDDAASAVDAVAALPLALRASLKAAAVAESAARPEGAKLSEVHFLEVL